MNVFRPDRPDGSVMIMAPGGGYASEMLDFEGMDVARHFNGAGVTCFVLRYRLPGEGWANRSDVPLQDAQRAMRLVRANADKYGMDTARVGFMGFSAGGHVPAPSPRALQPKFMRRWMRRQSGCPPEFFRADVSGRHHGRGLP